MSDTNLPYRNYSLKKKGGEAIIAAEVPADILAHYEAEVLKSAQKDFEIPGFRKGQVPLAMVKERINPGAILEEAAEHALEHAYQAILENEKLRVIGAPRADITKLASGNPLSFTITVPLLPEITLPDYKKIAREVMAEQKPITVTDEEVMETIRNFQRMRQKPDEKDSPLPELTDEYAKQLGKFSGAAELKEKIRTNLMEEKNYAGREARREEIALRLIAATRCEVPESLLTQELASIYKERDRQLAEAHMTLDDYLKQIGKTKEELEKAERDSVEKQFKTRFIFREIAEKENFRPDPVQVEHNVAALMKREPGADREHVRRYVENMLANEQVLKLLEGEHKPA